MEQARQWYMLSYLNIHIVLEVGRICSSAGLRNGNTGADGAPHAKTWPVAVMRAFTETKKQSPNLSHLNIRIV